MELSVTEVRNEVFEFCDKYNDNQSRLTIWEILQNTSVDSWKKASDLYGEWIREKYGKKSDEEE